jgi:hypothetical protein
MLRAPCAIIPRSQRFIPKIPASPNYAWQLLLLMCTYHVYLSQNSSVHRMESLQYQVTMIRQPIGVKLAHPLTLFSCGGREWPPNWTIVRFPADKRLQLTEDSWPILRNSQEQPIKGRRRRRGCRPHWRIKQPGMG